MNIRFENLLKHFDNLIIKELNELDIHFYIAGGCIRDYFMSKRTSDIDLFFTREKDFRTVLEHFIRNEVEIILNNDKVVKLRYKDVIFDLVKMLFANEEKLLNSFDFTVTQFAISENLAFYYTEEAFQDLVKKQLMLNNLQYPESTMKRVRKYMMKGFNICHEEIDKIILAIRDKHKVKNIFELESINFHKTTFRTYKSDHLTGMDKVDVMFKHHSSVFVSNDDIEDLGGFVMNPDDEEINSSYNFYGID